MLGWLSEIARLEIDYSLGANWYVHIAYMYADVCRDAERDYLYWVQTY